MTVSQGGGVRGRQWRVFYCCGVTVCHFSAGGEVSDHFTCFQLRQVCTGTKGLSSSGFEMLAELSVKDNLYNHNHLEV